MCGINFIPIHQFLGFPDTVESYIGVSKTSGSSPAVTNAASVIAVQLHTVESPLYGIMHFPVVFWRRNGLQHTWLIIVQEVINSHRNFQGFIIPINTILPQVS